MRFLATYTPNYGWRGEYAGNSVDEDAEGHELALCFMAVDGQLP